MKQTNSVESGSMQSKEPLVVRGEIGHLLSVNFIPDQRAIIFGIIEKLIEEAENIQRTRTGGNIAFGQQLRAKWLN